MSNSNWVRLNVGGKTFQTTKGTLSRCSDSFLARLVNGELASEKDETGAYLVDGDPKHFETILTYLRRGVLNLDGNEKTTKDLLSEADFYNIQPLVDEIQRAMRPVTNRVEVAIVTKKPGNVDIGQEKVNYIAYIVMSEKGEDYDVIQALRQKIELKYNGRCTHYITSPDNCDTWLKVESTLRSFGFVKEEISAGDRWDCSMCVKFIRTVSK